MQNDLQDAVVAARKLLGYILVHDTPTGLVTGRIVETEAYTADDAASHSSRGKTARTAAMFGPPGHAYIYFTYGMHYCFNVVTGPAGQGQGVLIRALEPLEGMEIMKQNRGVSELHSLTNGPAKLVQALGITKADYGVNLLDGGRLRLELSQVPAQVTQTTRVGITKDIDRPWRFYVTNNPFVSRF